MYPLKVLDVWVNVWLFDFSEDGSPELVAGVSSRLLFRRGTICGKSRQLGLNEKTKL